MIDEWRDNEYGTTCGYRKSTGMRDSVLGKKRKKKIQESKNDGVCDGERDQSSRVGFVVRGRVRREKSRWPSVQSPGFPS
jgi:hypothetical protein